MQPGPPAASTPQAKPPPVAPLSSRPPPLATTQPLPPTAVPLTRPMVAMTPATPIKTTHPQARPQERVPPQVDKVH